MFLQNADAFGDGFVLHGGFGLRGRFAVGGRIGGGGSGGVVGCESGGLLAQVGGDVDHFEGLGIAAYGCGLQHVGGDGIIAVGNDPALCPEIVDGRVRESVDFVLGDGVALAVGVELARLALDRDMGAVAASDGDGVDADVALGGAGEVGLALGPVRPVVAFGDVPVADVGAGGDGDVFEPSAGGLVGAHFVDGVDCLPDDGLGVVGGYLHLHRPLLCGLRLL